MAEEPNIRVAELVQADQRRGATANHHSRCNGFAHALETSFCFLALNHVRNPNRAPGKLRNAGERRVVERHKAARPIESFGGGELNKLLSGAEEGDVRDGEKFQRPVEGGQVSPG